MVPVTNRNYRQEIIDKSKKINRMAIGLSLLTIFIFFVVIGYCFVSGKTPQETVAIGTILFWLGIISYALGFTLSYFLRSQVRMDVGLDLSIQMVEQTEELEKRFDEGRKRFDSTIVKAEELMANIQKIVDDGKDIKLSERIKNVENILDEIRMGLLGDFKGLEAKGHKF